MTSLSDLIDAEREAANAFAAAVIACNYGDVSVAAVDEARDVLMSAMAATDRAVAALAEVAS